MSDNPLAEKIGDNKKIGDKKSAINTNRLYSLNEGTACVFFGFFLTVVFPRLILIAV